MFLPASTLTLLLALQSPALAPEALSSIALHRVQASLPGAFHRSDASHFLLPKAPWAAAMVDLDPLVHELLDAKTPERFEATLDVLVSSEEMVQFMGRVMPTSIEASMKQVKTLLGALGPAAVKNLDELRFDRVFVSASAQEDAREAIASSLQLYRLLGHLSAKPEIAQLNFGDDPENGPPGWLATMTDLSAPHRLRVGLWNGLCAEFCAITIYHCLRSATKPEAWLGEVLAATWKRSNEDFLQTLVLVLHKDSPDVVANAGLTHLVPAVPYSELQRDAHRLVEDLDQMILDEQGPAAN